MKIVINAIASTAGGGKTYLFHLAERLREMHGCEIDLWVPPAAHEHFQREFCKDPRHITVRTSRLAYRGFAGRLLWEQLVLPWRLRRDGVGLLLCLGNFCPLWSRVPVVLLSANALYFSPRYLRDLLTRRHYGWALSHLLRTRLAIASARSADAVFTPTKAMAAMLCGASRRSIDSCHSVWFGHHHPPGGTSRRHNSDSGEIRFLIHSFYNYFRNFETVLRALALVRKSAGRNVRLLLSTRLEPGLKLGGYDTTGAARLIRDLHLGDAVTCLGHVPHTEVGDLLASVDGLIAAGYVESFSFTVVEGMAAGLPVLASDIPVHREVGGDAVSYFPAFDPEQLAARWLELMEDESLRDRLSAAGPQRAMQFDWGKHFSEVFRVAREVAA